jgi:Mrp family chromosome partitioning ATPase
VGELTDALRRARDEHALGTVPAGHRAGEGAAGAPAERERAEVPGAAGPPAAPPAPDAPIATLSRAKAGEWTARAVLVNAPSGIAESFRRFALRLRPALGGRRSVLVTSALRREGKTVTACNLALALASMAERRLALVDLDLHRPGVARGLGIQPAVGLERALEGAAALGATRIRTEIPTLDAFAVAASRPRAHEIFSTRRFRELLAELGAAYDLLVIDTPPVLPLPDVALIAPHVGGYVAVVRAGDTPRSAFREMLELLPRDRLVGCFLNDARLPRHARYASYYGEEEAVSGPPAAG